MFNNCKKVVAIYRHEGWFYSGILDTSSSLSAKIQISYFCRLFSLNKFQHHTWYFCYNADNLSTNDAHVTTKQASNTNCKPLSQLKINLVSGRGTLHLNYKKTENPHPLTFFSITCFESGLSRASYTERKAKCLLSIFHTKQKIYFQK